MLRTSHVCSGLVVLVSVLAGCAGNAPQSASADAPQASTLGTLSGKGDSVAQVHQPAAANGEIVAHAMDALFVDFDLAAADRYFSAAYIEHDPLVADGLGGLRDEVANRASLPGFRYERVRVLTDGPLVAVHGRYTGLAAASEVAFDLFRIADCKIVEHWNAVQPETKPNPSGHTELDGTIEIHDRSETERNRGIVGDLIDTVFIGGDASSLPRFISAKTYIQHNPDIGDGLSSLVDAIGGPSATHVDFGYEKLHHLVAVGDFVLAHTEGSDNRTKIVFFDMWRMDHGLAVEHWDVVQNVPTTSANDNGMF